LDSTIERTQNLGWNDELEATFEPYRQRGFHAARVAAQYKGAYVLYWDGPDLWAELPGRMLHRAEGALDLPAVGDWVVFEPLPPPSRSMIQALLPRRSAFVRKVAGETTQEQVVAANVDVVFLVNALNEDLNPRRIERYLTLAWESGANPVIVLTKSDICPDLEGALTEVQGVALGAPIHIVSNVTGDGVADLQTHIRTGRTIALLGSSGVGKSSLVNSLVGEEVQTVKDIREDGRGRHTTTHRELIALPQGGLVLDTPGMRELQLWEASDGIQGSFEDIVLLAHSCRFRDCTHRSEPGCAIRKAIKSGRLKSSRYESYLKLQRELQFLETRRDKRAQSDARKKFRSQARARRR
jgi:ribosome biogenesis GTPase / thiamine phosphate phosphatase